jgi:hypothetical protein
MRGRIFLKEEGPDVVALMTGGDDLTEPVGDDREDPAGAFGKAFLAPPGEIMADSRRGGCSRMIYATRTSTCRPSAWAAASIWSMREAYRRSNSRSTWGMCQPRRRANSDLRMPCSVIAW